MEFKDFLKHKRDELDLSQAKVAKELTLRGHATGPGRVGHWETGRNKPPLEDPRFRDALAAVLSMDVNELMAELGYVISEEDRVPEAQIAASIVQRLPPDGRQLAIDYLELLDKRFSHAG